MLLGLFGNTFTELMLDLITQGCFDRLEYLGLVNLNLSVYLANKLKIVEKLEFLRVLSKRAVAFKEVDIRSNNLTAS